MSDKLLEGLQALSKSRSYLELAQAKIKELKDKQKKELEALEEELKLNDYKFSISDLEGKIKEEAIKVFEDNSEKKTLIGGVKIQERSTISYDETKALNWAIEHKLFLNLDKNSFETYAKKNNQLDFVRSSKSIIATLPKKIEL